MPNRYEREIEEILRNLESSEPKQGLGQKFGEKLRRKPNPRPNSRPRARQVRHLSFTFTLSDQLLIFAIIVALVSGGYAYIMGPNLITFILAVVGIVSLFLVAFSQFLFQPRRAQTMRYGTSNITISRIRRNPLNAIKTQWNLLKLRMRYKRKNGGSKT